MLVVERVQIKYINLHDCIKLMPEGVMNLFNAVWNSHLIIFHINLAFISFHTQLAFSVI